MRLPSGVERPAIAVEALSLGLWAGAMFAFAFLFAPAAFVAIPNLTVFGALVARVIGAVGTLGSICGALALAAELLRFAARGNVRAIVLRALLIFVALGATQIELHAIVPQMTAVAARIAGPVDSVPKTDPRRAEYDALHGRSSQVYGFAFVCICGALLAVAFGRAVEARPWLPMRR